MAPGVGRAWLPVLLHEEDVSEEELEGYRIWKEESGRPFSFDARDDGATGEESP